MPRPRVTVFERTGIIGRVRGARKTLGNASLPALGDQAFVSAANFTTLVLLARSVSPTAFGEFSIVYAGMLFVNSLQFALITQPHNIFGATRLGRDYARYTSSTAVMQLVLVGAIAGAGVLLALAAVAIGSRGASIILLAIPAVAAWQIQEFLRRVLYTEGRHFQAFMNDVISYGGQVLLVSLLWKVGRLDQANIFVVMAITSLVAVIVGLWQVRRALTRDLDLASVSENWAFGKWLGAGAGGYWLATQLYTWLVAALIGVAQVGTLRAAQLLLGPLNVLMGFLDGVLPRRFAQRQAAGSGQLNVLFRRAHVVTAPAAALYCLLVSILAEPLLKTVYGVKYAGDGRLVVLFAVYYFAMFWATIVCAALRSQGQSRSVFRAYGYGSVVLIGLGSLLMIRLRAEGAILGNILSAIALNVVFWRAFTGRAVAGRVKPIVADRTKAVP